MEQRPADAPGGRRLGPIGSVRGRLPRGRGVLLLAAAIAVAIVAGVVLGRALGAQTVAPATPPDLVLRRQLPHLLATLDHARVSGRAALADARTAGGQERAARALAHAHLEAAEVLRALPSEPARALAGELGAASRAYTELGRAAQGSSAARFTTARDDVSRAEAGIRRTLPAAVAAAATPAPAAGPSRLTLVMVMVVFGLLGAGLSLLRLPERIAAARVQRSNRLAAPRPGTATPVRAAPRAPAEADSTPTASAPRPSPPARGPAPTHAASTPRPSRTAPSPAPTHAASTPRPSRTARSPAPTHAASTPQRSSTARTAATAPTPAAPAPRRSAPALEPTTAAATAAGWLRPARPAPATATAAAPARPAARAAAAAPSAAAARRPPARSGTRPARRRPRAVPAPFPPDTGWSCEITWHASLRSAGFRATAKAPGQPEQLIAESPQVSWPPLLPPLPDDDVLAAARTLARALRDAGWTAVSRGESWYAQRFVWRAADDPQPLGD